MEMSDEFWVRRGKGISAIGIPLIVMSALKSGQRHWIGEYFIVIAGRHPAFLAQRTSVDTKDVPEDVLRVDAAWMKAELEQQVKTAISIRNFDLYEKTKSDVYLQYVELEDGDRADILHFWMLNQHQQEIERIKEMTQSAALKSFLTDVVRLSPIVVTPLA